MHIALFFATREGQTQRIAGHIANQLRAQGVEADLFDVAHVAEPLALEGYAAAILASSVHIGRHAREMVAFVKRHRNELERIPCAFLSISLTEAGVEMPSTPPAQREQSVHDVLGMLDDFFHETGWHPERVLPVAGALAYRRYNPLVRLIIKRISKKAGGPTDTSRDWELTDWEAIDRFIGELMRSLPERAAG